MGAVRGLNGQKSNITVEQQIFNKQSLNTVIIQPRRRMAGAMLLDLPTMVIANGAAIIYGIMYYEGAEGCNLITMRE